MISVYNFIIYQIRQLIETLKTVIIPEINITVFDLIIAIIFTALFINFIRKMFGIANEQAYNNLNYRYQNYKLKRMGQRYIYKQQNKQQKTNYNNRLKSGNPRRYYNRWK